MKLSPIIAQIQAECPSFKQVAGSASSDMELKASPGSLPAAYVILSDMDGDLSEQYGNEFAQELTERFIGGFRGNCW